MILDKNSDFTRKWNLIEKFHVFCPFKPFISCITKPPDWDELEGFCRPLFENQKQHTE